MSLTEQQADDEAKKRNLELAERGVQDGFVVPVERPDGTWELQQRDHRGGKFSRLVSRVLDLLP